MNQFKLNNLRAFYLKASAAPAVGGTRGGCVRAASAVRTAVVFRLLRNCNRAVKEQIAAYRDIHAARANIAVCLRLVSNGLKFRFHNTDGNKCDNKTYAE